MKFACVVVCVALALGLAEAANEIPALSAKCTEPVEVGTCSLKLLRYYYDTKTGECKEFKFGGCRGNNNRFGTKEFCEKECKKSVKTTTIQPTVFIIKPTTKSTIIQPTVKPTIVQPTVKSTVIQPTVKSTVIQPTVKSTVIQPTVKSTVIQPTVKSTTAQPINKPIK